jgi:hypothetical protein
MEIAERYSPDRKRILPVWKGKAMQDRRVDLSGRRDLVRVCGNQTIALDSKAGEGVVSPVVTESPESAFLAICHWKRSLGCRSVLAWKRSAA